MSRSLLPNHLLTLSQWYINANSVSINSLVPEMPCRQTFLLNSSWPNVTLKIRSRSPNLINSSSCPNDMSRLMTKPTKWHPSSLIRVFTVRLQKLRSAWASTQSDQSSLCTQWVAKDPRLLHADSEYSDQTGRMPRLIWIFAGRTGHFVGFVMRRLIYPYNFGEDPPADPFDIKDTRKCHATAVNTYFSIPKTICPLQFHWSGWGAGSEGTNK